MRVAALYDIHGNLPALDAVLAELQDVAPDGIVVGGDVGGPLVVETIERLMPLGAHFVRGNHDRELVDAFDGAAAPVDDGVRWAAQRLEQRHRDFLAGFVPAVRIDIPGLGPTLFCHGSPRSDEEDITTRTPEPRLEALLAGVGERVVVCGHSHRQFDRRVSGLRIVNAGAVGLPHEGVAAAFWLLLGPDVQLRRTDYDVSGAAARMRATGFPGVEAMVRDSLLDPADPDVIADHLERASRPS
jgi:predicted phosphodiesterase